MRQTFGLPARPARAAGGLECRLCANCCRIAEGERGYCGLRFNRDGRLHGGRVREGHYSSYYDSLPTNCVADWVCAGGTSCGFPEYSYVRDVELGYKNLAVFFKACTFNCLFCQNWHYREESKDEGQYGYSSIGDDVDKRTSCVCYFGGDPTPQLAFALKASQTALQNKKGKILRICWETNGSMNEKLLRKAAVLSLESGGCIKFDLKAWHEELHLALCGVSNRQTLSNFRFLAELSGKRSEPPFLVSSTLLVPGYVDEIEVRRIAEFIASLNPDIPYSLLGFYPHFYMKDLPTTSRNHAKKCLQAARSAGLRRVRVGNIHLLKSDY